jgi:hypothetical protein
MRAAGLGAVVAGLWTAVAGSPARAQSSAASGIVGTWRVRVSIPATPPRHDVIDYLVMFMVGGVFLGNYSPAEPTSDRTGVSGTLDYQGLQGGQWLQLATGAVRARAVQLNYDLQGRVTHEEHYVYLLTYDGATDSLSGTAEWREVSTDGRVTFTVTVPITGTRVGAGD